MKDGDWIPMDKSLVMGLPKERPYSPVEAAFSYQLYLDKPEDKRQQMSVCDWSRIWKWSRTRVCNFIKNNKATRFGQTKDRTNAFNFRFINNLNNNKTKTKTDQKQSKDEPRTAYYNPNPETPIQDTEERLNSSPPPAKNLKKAPTSRKPPADFLVTDDMLDWAQEQGLSRMRTFAETEKFKDYEYAKAKSDWLAAWRNWIRKAVELDNAPRPLGKESGIFAGARGFMEGGHDER